MGIEDKREKGKDQRGMAGAVIFTLLSFIFSLCSAVDQNN
jgi:hypothetical protein